jgi:FKBP-type peptidyl-prolyl cis-trans isomerase 2
MKVGETKKIVLPPKDAYGEYDLNKVSTFDKNAFGADFNKMWIGRGIVHPMLGPGKIIKLNDSNAVIDFNPELAGQTLTFDINVVSIK